MNLFISAKNATRIFEHKMFQLEIYKMIHEGELEEFKNLLLD